MSDTLPPYEPDDQDPPAAWRAERPRAGIFATLSRLLLLGIILLLVALPFTPYAGKIKRALVDISQGKTTIREVIREVPKEIVRVQEKKVIVEVPAPPPPLPDRFIARKEADVATFFNGMTINTKLETNQGSFASLERLDPEAYKVQFQVSIRVPKPNQTLGELSRINPNLPAALPGLEAMLGTAKVSGFFHKLYENKTSLVQRDLTRLNKILDRHNFYDCETILELKHPQSSRKVMLIQSEMDVVCDGSDGDRAGSLDDYISLSDYYQPFTSYAWAKKGKTPNPLLARWESKLSAAKAEYAKKGLSAERNRQLKASIDYLGLEIRDMKARSSLIADSDPFVVISLVFRGYANANAYTPQIGDYAVVIHDKKLFPAICGDYGPTMKMGEASLFMAKAINEKATPYRRPESDLKVTYLIFPGTAKKPFGPPNLEEWRQQCITYLNDMGGIGAGFEVHTWEDKFKKPEVVKAPEVTAPAVPATAPATPASAPMAPTPVPAAATPAAKGTSN
jgi:hypothetical protein